MGIMPDGENIRKAVKWVSLEKEEKGKEQLSSIIQEACLRFDLSPSEAEFLSKFLKGEIGKE